MEIYLLLSYFFKSENVLFTFLMSAFSRFRYSSSEPKNLPNANTPIVKQIVLNITKSFPKK